MTEDQIPFILEEDSKT